MTKKDIVDHIIDCTSLSREQAKDAVESTLDALCRAMIDMEPVYLRGFATIKPFVSKRSKARNISKGVSINIPERNSAKLIICAELKERMNS